MMACGIHQNDIGTEIRVQIVDCNNVAVDISLASNMQILFKKPSGSLLTKSATFVTDGSDGYIYYTIADGDLDEIGSWKVQAIVTLGSYIWHSSFESFKVHRNL
jgi:hypothetical protein